RDEKRLHLAVERDCEIAGQFNVLAIAQSGSEGLPVSISFDRGASFPLVTDVAPGSRTRLARIFMAPDYKTAVLFWDFGAGSATSARLLLVEGAPASFDVNNSPDSFTFAAPIVLLTTGKSAVPLVPDVKYTSCGDAFVAYGVTEQLPNGIGRTTIGSFRRYAGDATFSGPVLLDDIEMIPFDPSIAVVGCGGTAQVWIAYESPSGITIKRSMDGAQTFLDVVRFGTRSAYGPRLFARPGAGGATFVDCLFIDLNDTAIGTDLRLFHSDADFGNASVYRIVEATPVTGTGGRNSVDAVGWFGFDATELNGKIYASVHVQRTEFFAPPMGGLGGFGRTTAAAPAAPRVLYPGMTQPVPAFDSNAEHRLSVIEIN
ncbi:MAG: hypothetical protein ACAI25_05680, partial [Planctomycetota bacterium]